MNKISNSRKLLSLAVSFGIANTAVAAVTISPYISNGSSGAIEEKQANLWFLLDDSGSMGTGDLYVNQNWNFRLDYDNNQNYILPKKIDGTTFPAPPSSGFYTDPFKEQAVAEENGTPLTLSTDTMDYSNCTGASSAAEQSNCRVFKSYYETKMKVLKASMSIVFHDPKNIETLNETRIGYTSLHNNGDSLGLNTNVLPVLPMYGANASANKTQFLTWLFDLKSWNGTPTRGTYSELVSQIIRGARDNISTGDGINGTVGLNPFLRNPGEVPEPTENPIVSCRRNYILTMTDGSWNVSSNADIIGDFSGIGITGGWMNIPSTNGGYTGFPTQSITLPDGIAYTPIPPFTSDRPDYDAPFVSDLAFTAWLTDMDSDSSNDSLSPLPILRAGEDYDTNPEVGGDPYWHPHNDPAGWQHINTYTMGFGLSNGTFNINKPNMDSDILDGTRAWDLNATNQNPTDPDSSVQIVGNSAAQDLANAAIAGRGKYYDVKKASDLTSAFDDLLANTKPVKLVSGAQGAGGSVSAGQSFNNAYYSTRYNVNDETTFGGEVIKQKLWDGVAGTKSSCFGTTPPGNARYGTMCNKVAWNAAKILSASGVWKDRNLVSLIRTKNGDAFTAAESYSNVDSADLGYSQIDFTRQGATPLSPLLQSRLIAGAGSAFDALSTDPNTLTDRLIDYIKGDGTYEFEATSNPTGLLRNRDNYPYLGISSIPVHGRNILGIIMRSTPLPGSIPYVSDLHPLKQSIEFKKFVNRYIYVDHNNICQSVTSPICTFNTGEGAVAEDHVDLVFVGGNDGVLHAFSPSTGKEVFGYVPNVLYNQLPNLALDGGSSLVDGNLTIEAINVKKDSTDIVHEKWKRILAGTFGGGARGLYALDITDPSKNDELVKWEYSDLESEIYQKENGVPIADIKSNVGNIMAKPSLVQLKDKTWVVVVGNGYNSTSKKAALLVINADTGETIQELVVENDVDGYTDGNEDNGLSPAYFVSYAGKSTEDAAFIDRAYAGDLQGNLWVFDFTNATAAGGVTVAKQDPADAQKPLFTATYLDGSVTKRQPITVAPFVKVHPKKYGYLVHFGTGALFEEEDLSSKVTNSVYAIWDDWVPLINGGLPAPRAGNVISRGNLNEIKFIETDGEDVQTVGDGLDAATKVDAKVRQLDVTNNAPTAWKYNNTVGDHRGWFIDLSDGERAWQPAFQTYGSDNVVAVGYNTVNYKIDGVSNDCLAPGKIVQSWQLTFNAKDGSEKVASYGTLDLDDDGDNTYMDMVDNGGLSSGAVSGKSNDNVVFNTVETSISTGGKGIVANGGSGGSGVVGNPRFCNFVIKVKGTSTNSTSSALVCRESHNSSWKQIVE